mmetsp:Transcript_87551/g.271989  ORF Transcript_87551/g.271989 Transcript_87551/m.271989 type:complete len:166 (+) Transcript_87551:99-596(+)
MSCYYVNDPPSESGGSQGRSYRGLVTTTISGRTCQKWTSDHPWKEAAKMEATPDMQESEGMRWGNGLGNHNYCRNPDQSMDSPWCFTQDPNEEHKKELCEIPECPEESRDFQSEHQQTVAKIQAMDCECADELYGSSQTTADTKVLFVQQKRMGVTKDGNPCTCR